MNRAITKQNVRDSFMRIGHEPVGGSPAEFGKLINSELARWKEVIQEAGIKAQE